MKKLLLSLVACAMLASGVAYAAGIFPYPAVTLPLTGAETIPVDTNLTQGLTPATEIISTAQLKDYVFGGGTNVGITAATATGATTTSAATCNAGRCRVTSAAMTLAAAGINVLTLTDSAITANSQVLFSIAQGTNTTADVTPLTATPSAGSALITLKNTNAGALNGTIIWNVVVIN